MPNAIQQTSKCLFTMNLFSDHKLSSLHENNGKRSTIHSTFRPLPTRGYLLLSQRVKSGKNLSSLYYNKMFSEYSQTFVQDHSWDPEFVAVVDKWSLFRSLLML